MKEARMTKKMLAAISATTLAVSSMAVAYAYADEDEIQTVADSDTSSEASSTTSSTTSTSQGGGSGSSTTLTDAAVSDPTTLTDNAYCLTFNPNGVGTGTTVVVGAKKYSDPITKGGATTTSLALPDLIDEDDLKGVYDTDLTVSITKKDALKLKGQYQVKGEIKAVNEDDNDYVSFEEDEAIADLGLSKENVNILKKTKADKVKLINVTVAKDGEIASTIGKSLKVEVANSFAGAKVYHVNSDGSLTLLDSKTPNMLDGSRTTTFSASSFSPFIITTADLKATKASTDDTSAASDDTTTSTTNNPNTGIALAIAPVVLAAGAVAVVALKKKH